MIFEGVYALHPDIRNSLDLWIAVVRFMTFTQMSLVLLLYLTGLTVFCELILGWWCSFASHRKSSKRQEPCWLFNIPEWYNDNSFSNVSAAHWTTSCTCTCWYNQNFSTRTDYIRSAFLVCALHLEVRGKDVLMKFISCSWKFEMILTLYSLLKAHCLYLKVASRWDIFFANHQT